MVKNYDNAYLSVKCGKDYTEKVDVTQEVLQGDCMSPFLFILLLVYIIHFFFSKKKVWEDSQSRQRNQL